MPKSIYQISDPADDSTNAPFLIIIDISRFSGNVMSGRALKDNWYLRTESAIKYRKGRLEVGLLEGEGTWGFGGEPTARLFKGNDQDNYGIELRGILSSFRTLNDDGIGFISSAWNFKFQSSSPILTIQWDRLGSA